jgi:tRNA-modifying protein YgfZ
VSEIAPTATYSHATSQVGVIDFSSWNTLRVSGADRAALLHNMCTNHIRDLAPGGGCEAFFTDVKGKVVAHAIVLAGENEFLLLLSPGQIERLATHLDRYIIREDVQLVDVTPEIQWMLIVGPRASALVQSIAGESELPKANWSHINLPSSAAATRAVRCNLPWCGGALLACAPDRSAPMLDALREQGAADCAEADWHAIRVESCWPLYGVDFDGSNLAQECGRDAVAIHLRKGCYLGQETVARIDALGHVNKQLQLVSIEGDPPEVGSEVLRQDQAAGCVTSACWSPRRSSSLAIAMLRHGVDASADDLTCNGRPAEVVESR